MSRKVENDLDMSEYENLRTADIVAYLIGRLMSFSA
jgi:hypothetical protein